MTLTHYKAAKVSNGIVRIGQRVRHHSWAKTRYQKVVDIFTADDSGDVWIETSDGTIDLAEMWNIAR